MLDRRKKAFFVIHSFCLSQRFPTGPLGSETRFTGVRNATFEDESLYVSGSQPDPWGPKQDLRGSEMRLLRMRVCMFLRVLHFKRTAIYES